MSNVVFMVPSPSGWLALDRDQFDRALRRGDAYLPTNSSSASSENLNLLSSQQMQDATGIPRTWFERQARERRIPFKKFGRYVRFVLAEVIASESFRRQSIPDGGALGTDTGYQIQSGAKRRTASITCAAVSAEVTKGRAAHARPMALRCGGTGDVD
jgi:hypothetical protein